MSPAMERATRLALLAGCLALPLAFVVTRERAATSGMLAAPDAAAAVPIASAADAAYCSTELKQVVRRVASACGLLDSGGRGCKPADSKAVAALSGDDFNALFRPLADRADIVQFDLRDAELDERARKVVETAWAEKRGASFFFVVARASTDGDAALNEKLSQARAQAVLNHLVAQFPGDEDLKKIGLLWLGEDYAQLGPEFCDWNRSRAGDPCAARDINRSAFVAWIDCAI
jgi:outer membrane protein OmpA-like peptidoglycan-associated protein